MSGFAGCSPPSAARFTRADDALSGASPISFAAVFSAGAGDDERKAVGLSLRMSAPGEFRIAVCCAKGRPLMELGPFGDDDVVAAWRRLSDVSGLPFVMQAEQATASDSSDEPFDDVPLPVDRRKRLTVLAGRRPRFLCRRKAARLPRSPLVHGGVEIAGGAGR